VTITIARNGKLLLFNAMELGIKVAISATTMTIILCHTSFLTVYINSSLEAGGFFGHEFRDFQILESDLHCATSFVWFLYGYRTEGKKVG
jgi:hypothetical protein